MMLKTFSTVEIFCALQMVYSLESFWRVYSQEDCRVVTTAASSATPGGEEVGAGRGGEQLKLELLHNLVMFVCTFFRYLDATLGFRGELVSSLGCIFTHLDRFGTSLLYENEALFVKSVRRTARLDYQMPRPMESEAVSGLLVDRCCSLGLLRGADKQDMLREVENLCFVLRLALPPA